MKSCGSDHNIAVSLEITSSVEGVDEFSQRSNSSVLELMGLPKQHTHFQFPPMKSLRAILSSTKNMCEGLLSLFRHHPSIIIKILITLHMRLSLCHDWPVSPVHHTGVTSQEFVVKRILIPYLK